MSDDMFGALFGDTTLDFAPDEVAMILFSVMAEAATSAVRARQHGDETATAICFGRVTAAFDTLAALGVPTPAEDAADVMMQAEAIVAQFDSDPEAFDGPGCDGTACEGGCA